MTATLLAPRVTRLGLGDEPSLAALLAEDEVAHLFLIGFLATHAIDRAWWYGVLEAGMVRAAVLVLPDRLAVPCAPDPDDAALLGLHLASRHRPCLVVGPRDASDRLFAHWAPGRAARRIHHQRLYRLESIAHAPDPAGFRLATWEDRAVVAAQAIAMEREDLGTDRLGEADAHEQIVQDRIQSGRTWVIERDGRLVFQVNVGTTHTSGCQIGGTWVPPEHRGRGYATAGIAATCRRLLATHPRVTLHVNESNLAAVRVYEKVGFVRDAAFRLLIP
jgi:RimJ/RimL family protein N-acetyltransferase